MHLIGMNRVKTHIVSVIEGREEDKSGSPIVVEVKLVQVRLLILNEKSKLN